MAEDELQLRARIVDEYSDSLRAMTKAAQQFQDLLRQGNLSGGRIAKEHAESQKGLEGRVGETARTMKELLTPAMAVMGLTAITAGAGLGKLFEGLKDAGDNFYKMQSAIAHTGLSLDDLSVRLRAMSEMDIPIDQAREAVSSMGDAMARLRRGEPGETQHWYQTFNNIDTFIAKVKGAKTLAEAMDFGFDFFKHNPNVPPDQKAKFYSELFHLPPGLATILAEQQDEEMNNAREYYRKHGGPLSQEESKDLRDAFRGVREEIEGLNLDMQHAFAGEGATALEHVAEIVHKEVVDFEAIVGLIQKISTMLPEWATGDITGKAATRMFQPPDKSFQSWRDSLFAPQPSVPGSPWSAQGLPGEGRLGSKGPGGGYKPISFELGGSSDDENFMSRSVKVGTLEALREFAASIQGERSGFQTASYTTGGGGLSGRGGGVVPRAFGGGGYKLLPEGGGSASGTTSTGSAGGGFDRSRFSAELAGNPALRDRLMRISMAEDAVGSKSGTLANQAIMETMMNRAAVRGTSLADQLRLVSEGHGYYPTMRGFNAAQGGILDENLRKVLAGSNVSGYATDNSSSWLAAKEKRSGAFSWITDINGESFFSPGNRDPKGRAQWAGMRERDLLSQAQSAGMSGGKIEGNASLDVNFNHLPQGATAYLKYGGLFKSARVDWGHSMSPSDPSGNP